MAIADLVPLYLTIVMIVLIFLALAGPGDKKNTSDQDPGNPGGREE